MAEEADPLESVPMSQILKTLEHRFDAYVLSTVYTGEDEEGNEGELFDCAMLGSKTMGLGLVARADIAIRFDIHQELSYLYEEEEEDEEEEDGELGDD